MTPEEAALWADVVCAAISAGRDLAWACTAADGVVHAWRERTAMAGRVVDAPALPRRGRRRV